MPGSAAAAAGIALNDEVTALDGKPITDYTQDQVNELFEKGATGSSQCSRSCTTASPRSGRSS